MIDDQIKQIPDSKKKELDVLDKMYEDYEKMAQNLYRIICQHYQQKDKKDNPNSS